MHLAFAANRLFVSTREGRVYAFASPPHPQPLSPGAGARGVRGIGFPKDVLHPKLPAAAWSPALRALRRQVMSLMEVAPLTAPRHSSSPAHAWPPNAVIEPGKGRSPD